MMDQTTEWYLQRLESVRGSGDAELEALVDLARALMEDMQFEDAQSYLEQALDLSVNLQQATRQRDIHGLMAITSINLQEMDSTFEHVQQAITLSYDAPDHLLEHFATLMIVLIMTPPDMPAHDYALSLIDEMRDRGAEPVMIHQMVQMLAETYGMAGDADRAIAILEAEVDRTDQNKWFTLMQLGSLEITLGQFNDGYRHLKEARQIASDQNDKEAEVVILMGLGAACVDSGRLDNGLRYLKSALAMTRELNDSEMEQMTLLELGNAYAFSEQFDDALETYRELIDVADANHDEEGKLIGWANTGNAYRDINDYDRAIVAYERALAFSRSLNNTFEEAEILIQMGQATVAAGDLKKGVATIEQAIPLFSQMNEEIEAGDAYLTIAELYAEHNRGAAAIDYAEKARQIFEQFQLHDLVDFVDEFIEDLQ